MVFYKVGGVDWSVAEHLARRGDKLGKNEPENQTMFAKTNY